MSQVPRRSARTTEEERRAIRASDESLKILARRYGINPKTVAKWKKRESAGDLPHRKPGRHRKLTAEEVGIIVQFRENTLLPLDDCLYALQAQIPHLSRSTLHRCLQRHGINRLAEASATERGVGRAVPSLWDLHIDTSQVHSNEGSHSLFNAIEQSSKFVFVQMGTLGTSASAADFLATLAKRSPFRIGRVSTVDGEPFVVDGEESEFARVWRKDAEQSERFLRDPHHDLLRLEFIHK